MIATVSSIDAIAAPYPQRAPHRAPARASATPPASAIQNPAVGETREARNETVATWASPEGGGLLSGTSKLGAMSEPSGDRVGFIGLGIMGSRMAANLAGAGFSLTVWNRTLETAKEWARLHGGVVAATPAELAAASDVVITMVVDAPQVESVLFGEDGVRAGAGEGLLCIDMSTIGPSAAVRIGTALGAAGTHFLDAPVTGSSPKAEDGTLTIMAGGEKADFERALPLFEAMGERIVHVGQLGDGQMVKLLNNALAAVNTAAVAEALLVAESKGIDLDALIEVVGAGSGGSAMLDLKAGPMRAHDYTTLFKLEHMLKDLRLGLEEAEAVGVGMGLAEYVTQLLQEGADEGLGDRDFAALLDVLEERSGVRL
jgi:3-hydroxyisobutyrate dehydrogenase-like beta-hydroxyacid dehydrogenase